MDKRKKTIIFTVIMLLTSLSGIECTAQTCRIAAGYSPEGHLLYKEVYEYDYVDEKPTFPGGDDKLVAFINKHRHYPAEAYRMGVEGSVTCSLVVNSDGSVSDIQVLRGVEASLNAEAVRILTKMPKWKAGRHEGHAVPVRVIRCIPFRR